jgi:hypothetical protein
MKLGDIILVKWDDAGMVEGDISLNKARKVKPVECSNVGFLVRQGYKSITIASGRSTPQFTLHCKRFRHTFVILRSSITYVLLLKEVVNETS